MNIRLTNPSVESHEKNLICYLTNRGSTKYNDFDWLLIYIRSTNHGSTAVQPTVQLAVQPYQLNCGWFGLASTTVEPWLSQPFNIPNVMYEFFIRMSILYIIFFVTKFPFWGVCGGGRGPCVLECVMV